MNNLSTNSDNKVTEMVKVTKIVYISFSTSNRPISLNNIFVFLKVFLKEKNNKNIPVSQFYKYYNSSFLFNFVHRTIGQKLWFYRVCLRLKMVWFNFQTHPLYNLVHLLVKRLFSLLCIDTLDILNFYYHLQILYTCFK